MSPVNDLLLEETIAEIQDRLDECDEQDLDGRWEVVLDFLDPEVGLVVATDRGDGDGSGENEPFREHAHLKGDDLDEPREGIIEALEAFEGSDGEAGEFEYDSIADPDMGDECTELAFRVNAAGEVLLVGAFDLDGDVDSGREAAIQVTRCRWLARMARRFGRGGAPPETLDRADIEPIDPEDVSPFLGGLAWNLVHESASAIYPELAWPVLTSLMDEARGIYMAVDQMDPDEDDEHVALAGWIRGPDLAEPNELLMDFVLLCADLLPDVQADLEVAADSDEEFESVVSVTAGPSVTYLALRMTPRGPIIVGLFDTDSLPDDDDREEAIETAYDAWVDAIESVYGPG